MKILVSVMAMLGLSAVASCGGGDDAKTCSGAAPCGGEIAAGHYKISSYCSAVTGTIQSQSCPAGIKVETSSLNVTGSLTFNADKTYQTDATVSGSVIETIPGDCLRQNGVQVTCAQLTQALQDPTSGMTVSCSGSGSCTCTLTLPPEQSVETGTYTTSGTTFTTTSSSGETSQNSYCATPTTVTITSSAMNMVGMMPTPMEMVMGNSSMVLTKE